jgi:uncharacterized membrane protein
MSTPTAESPTNAPERKGFYVPGWLLAVLGAVVALAAAVAIGFAWGRDGGSGEEGGQEVGFQHHDGDGHALGIIVLLILIAGVIAVAVFLARRSAARPGEVKTSAEDVLAERLARGEIDEADYLSRRNALRS